MATCDRCGSEIPEDAPGGECPRCVMEAGLDGGAGAPEPFDRDELARLFPSLEIGEILGRGGMGVVYRARQKALDRTVALKILPREVAGTPGFADRFRREARVLARLSHPHIVMVHEAGQTEDLYYLVMEYVDGASLRSAMEGGGLTPEHALAIVPQVCEVLQYAHDQGVVHRDIKPENILLDREGRVKIADFGLVKLLGAEGPDRGLTGTEQVMGTFHYMAPEQISGPKDVDHRADIYSLGVVFYEMLTGELPMGRFPAPSQRVRVDVRLDEVVLRALERERDRRYQRVDEVGTRVTRIASTPDGAAPPPAAPPTPAAAPRSLAAERRTSRLAIAGVLAGPAAVVLVIGTALLDAPPLPILPWAGLLLLAGSVVSIVAWIRIGTSRGRLSGTWAAVLGTFFPLLMCRCRSPSPSS